MTKNKTVTIPVELYKELWLAVDAIHNEAASDMERTADLLANFHDAPHDVAVSAALRNLAHAKDRRDKAAKLLRDMEKCEPDGI